MSSPTPDQLAAWSFYGLPPSARTVTPVGKHVARPVGEVSYVIGWISNQLSRLQWRVLIDGSDTWSVRTPDGERVSSDGTSANAEDTDHPVTASSTLLDLVGWTPGTVKLLSTNLFVAGECDYTYTLRRGRPSPTSPQGRWDVVSVIKPKRKELIEAATYSVRALWPHPADPCEPDAPLSSALPILSQLDWLTRLSEAQSSTRVGLRGVAGIADSMATASGRDFWEELHEATQANMDSPDNLSPVVVRGPAEMVEPTGGGMRGFSWLVPEFPYDERIEERIQQAIQRLAYSLPIPPEILLGLQAQSRATAFQVEESAYRGHIEPPAEIIARVAAEALTLLLDTSVEVIADPTRLLARRHSVQDVLDAFDRGAVSLAYLREVLAIPEHAAPTAEDLEILYRLRGRSDAQATPDPGNVAAQDPFPSQQSAMLAAMSPQAQEILSEFGPERAGDVAQLFYLAGVSEQITDRARERVGAKARTHPSLRNELAPEIPNQQVAAALGVQRLRDEGVLVDDCVDHALLGIGPHSGLIGPLREHILATLENDSAEPLPDMALIEALG